MPVLHRAPQGIGQQYSAAIRSAGVGSALTLQLEMRVLLCGLAAAVLCAACTDIGDLPAQPTGNVTSQPAPSPGSPTGQQITIVRRFAAPGRPEGLTWDGQSLWVSDNGGSIFKLGTTGDVLGNFSAPEVTPQGITWDGSAFWLFTTNQFFIYQFRVSGDQTTTIQSFRSQAAVIGGGLSQDLAWDGSNLWHANRFNIFRMTPEGVLVNTLSRSKDVDGLDWDGSRLWLGENNFPNFAAIIAIDTTGRTLGTFVSPVFEIEALAWGAPYLWALGTDTLAGTETIYQLDISRAVAALAR